MADPPWIADSQLRCAPAPVQQLDRCTWPGRALQALRAWTSFQLVEAGPPCGFFSFFFNFRFYYLGLDQLQHLSQSWLFHCRNSSSDYLNRFVGQEAACIQVVIRAMQSISRALYVEQWGKKGRRKYRYSSSVTVTLPLAQWLARRWCFGAQRPVAMRVVTPDRFWVIMSRPSPKCRPGMRSRDWAQRHGTDKGYRANRDRTGAHRTDSQSSGARSHGS